MDYWNKYFYVCEMARFMQWPGPRMKKSACLW